MNTPPPKQSVLCCSYPKSGRSWLRFVLANYLNKTYSLGLTINFNNLFTLLPNNGPSPQRGIPAYRYKDNADIPLILFDHSLYTNNYASLSVIFLIRNEKDTLVSNFHQDKYRIKCFNGSIEEYIRSENGIKRYIQYLNSWSTGLEQNKHIIASYEMMHKSMSDVMRDIINNILYLKLDDIALKKAIDSSNFNTMRKAEIESGFPNPMLKIDPSDCKTLRAREGKVGNYTKHLSENDIEYINKQCTNYLSNKSKTLLKKYCEQL